MPDYKRFERLHAVRLLRIAVYLRSISHTTMRSILLLLCWVSLQAQAQIPEWAFALDGPGSDDVQFLAAGADGSVTVLGRLGGLMDMDPGAVSNPLDAGTATNASYLARYTSGGALQWAFPLLTGPGANEQAQVHDLSVGPEGNTYVAIELVGSVELAPLAPSVNVTAGSVGQGFTNAQDLLLVAYAADGSFAWHKHMQGDGARLEGPLQLTVRADGDVIMSGSYNGSIDLDQSLTSTTDSLHVQAENSHAFLVAYTASGSVEWALDFDGPCSITGLADLQPGFAIALKPNISSPGQLDLDPGPGTSFESSDMNYLLLWDANLSMIFSLEFTAHRFVDLVRTGPGDVAWVGEFEGTMTVGDSTYNNGGGPDHAYVAQLNLVPYSTWSRYFPIENGGFQLGSNGDESFFLAFGLNDPVDPDGSGPTPVLTPIGDDIGVVHYSNTAAVMHHWQIGTVTDDLDAPSIAVNPVGDVFLGGQMQGSVDVHPGADVMNVTATAGSDGGLLVKYGDLTTGLSAPLVAQQLVLWPVPVHDQLYMRLPAGTGPAHWELLNPCGAQVARGTCSSSSRTCTLAVQHLAPGAYVVHAVADGRHLHGPFVKH